jgi:transposase InsO family protein
MICDKRGITDMKVRQRLFMIEEGKKWGILVACQRLGVHRSYFYYWKKRYDQGGVEGLDNRSTRPHHSPTKIRGEKVRLISELREHTQQGPKTISSLMNRNHGIHIPSSTVHRVLVREGYITAKERKVKTPHVKRYQSKRPGDRVQIDIKYIPYRLKDGTKGRGYQYTAIDDCTRVRFVKLYDGMGIYQLKDFLAELKIFFPFKIRLIQTDNAVIFTYKYTAHLQAWRNEPKTHFLETWCKENSVRHVLIKPGEPALNGKVERSHRTDQQFFYDWHHFKTLPPLKAAFDQWLDYYNHDRIHWGIEGQTPQEKLATFGYQLPILSTDQTKGYSLAA